MHLMHTAESGLGKRPLTAAFVGLPRWWETSFVWDLRGKKRPSLRGIAVQKRRYGSRRARSCLPPVVRGDTLTITRNAVWCVRSTATGSSLWERDLEVLIRVAPVLRGSSLIVGDGRGGIRGLRLADGQETWQDSVESGVRARPLVGSEHIWLSTAAGQIIALDGATGVEQWQVDIGGLPTGEMASTEGVIGVGAADRSVCGIEASTGTVRWAFKTEGVVREAPPLAQAFFTSDQRWTSLCSRCIERRSDVEIPFGRACIRGDIMG